MLIMVYVLLILALQNFWGLVNPISLKVGPINLYFSDFLNVTFVSLSIILFTRKYQSLHAGSAFEASKRIPYAAQRLLRAFLLYTAVLFVYSMYLGTPIKTCFRFSANLFPYIAYLFIPLMVYKRKQFTFFLKVIYIICLIAVAVNLLQNITGWMPGFVTGPGYFSYTMPMGMLFRTYNSSVPLIMLLCLLFLLKVLASKQSGLFVNMLLLTLASVSLIFTFTRNIIVGYVVVFLFISCCAFWKERQLLGRFKMVLTGIVIIVLLGCQFIIPDINERMIHGVQEVEYGEGTYASRFKILTVGWESMEEGGMDGLLFGKGYQIVFLDEENLVYDPLLNLQNTGSDSGIGALLYRFGIVGVILYALFSLRYLQVTIRRYRTCNSRGLDAYLLVGPALVVWAWIISFAGNMFFQPNFTIVLVTGMAISEMAYRLWVADLRRGSR